MKRRRLFDYARLQRWIRSRPPTVRAAEADAQARRAIAVAHTQQDPNR